jgi:O-antigen/teichoic acid export membrane protein
MSLHSSGRFERITAGLAANGVTLAVQLIIRFAEVPILLKLWGAVGFGEWLLISALPTAFAFSDGGFTKTARREMAIRAGQGDLDGVSKAFQSAWILLLVVSTLFMAILWLVLQLLPLHGWLHIQTVDVRGLDISLLILALQVMIFFQCGLLHGGYICSGRYALGEVLIALSYLLSFIGVVLGALTGHGIPGAAVGGFLGQCLGFAVMLIVYSRTCSHPNFGSKSASVREVQAQMLPSAANLAFPLSDALSIQGLRIVVGLTLGPVALAMFSTTRTLCRTAMQPVLAIARTLEPELSIAYGSGQAATAQQLFMRASHAAFWLSLVACAFIFATGPFLYEFWSGGKLQLDRGSFYLLLFSSLANVIWGVALTVPNSVNRHASIALRFVVFCGIGGVAFAYGLCRLTGGAWGAAAAILFSDLLGVWIVVTLALRISGATLTDWTRQVLRSPIDLVKEIVAKSALPAKRRRRT